MGRVTQLEAAVQKLQSSLLKLDLRFKSHRAKCKLNRVQLEERIKKLHKGHKCNCRYKMSAGIEFTPEPESERDYVPESDSVDSCCVMGSSNDGSSAHRSKSQTRSFSGPIEKVRKKKTNRIKKLKEVPDDVPEPEGDPDHSINFAAAASLAEAERSVRKTKPNRMKELKEFPDDEPEPERDPDHSTNFSTAASLAELSVRKTKPNRMKKLKEVPDDEPEPERDPDHSTNFATASSLAEPSTTPKRKSKKKKHVSSAAPESLNTSEAILHITADDDHESNTISILESTSEPSTSEKSGSDLHQSTTTSGVNNDYMKLIMDINSKIVGQVGKRKRHLTERDGDYETKTPHSKRGASKVRSIETPAATKPKHVRNTSETESSNVKYPEGDLVSQPASLTSPVIGNNAEDDRRTTLPRVISLKTVWESLRKSKILIRPFDVPTTEIPVDVTSQVDVTPITATQTTQRRKRGTRKRRSVKEISRSIPKSKDCEDSTEYSESQSQLTPYDSETESDFRNTNGNLETIRKSKTKACLNSSEASKSAAPEVVPSDPSLNSSSTNNIATVPPCRKRRISRSRSCHNLHDTVTESEESIHYLSESGRSETTIDMEAETDTIASRVIAKSPRNRRATSEVRSVRRQLEYSTDSQDSMNVVDASEVPVRITPDVDTPNTIPTPSTVRNFVEPYKVPILFSESKTAKSRSRTAGDIRKPTWLVEHQHTKVKPKTSFEFESSYKSPKNISSVSACLKFHAGIHTSPA